MSITLTHEQLHELNETYKYLQTMKKKYLLYSAKCKVINSLIDIPVGVFSAVSTTLSSANLVVSGQILKILVLISSFLATSFHSLSTYLDLPKTILKCEKLADQYNDLALFLECEKNVNYGRTKDFYPYEPDLARDAGATKDKSIVIESSEEYAQYLFGHIAGVLEDIQDEVLPEAIDRQTFDIKDLYAVP